MVRKFKKCFITGITGAGGSYLAEHILKKDKSIKIYGSYRSTGNKNLLQKRYKKKIGDIFGYIIEVKINQTKKQY